MLILGERYRHVPSGQEGVLAECPDSPYEWVLVGTTARFAVEAAPRVLRLIPKAPRDIPYLYIRNDSGTAWKYDRAIQEGYIVFRSFPTGVGVLTIHADRIAELMIGPLQIPDAEAEVLEGTVTE